MRRRRTRSRDWGIRERGRRGPQSAFEIQGPARMGKEMQGTCDQSARILDIKHILSVFVLFL